MKIITCVRTLNEERNIAEFIETHSSLCDYIFIADGGSSDKTLDIAMKYPNAKIREFTERIYTPDKSVFKNHESKHVKFLFDWAIAENADVVLQEDCDHFPNPRLQKDGRQLIENDNHAIISVLLMYTYGSDGKYFPFLNENAKPPDRMFGWRPAKYIPTLDLDDHLAPTITNHPDLSLADCLRLPHPPYALIHRGWPDEATVKRKMDWYALWGMPQLYPPTVCGELAPLPEWVYQ
jgi:glycosyltransferase involved in cell wall biosynthesis